MQFIDLKSQQKLIRKKIDGKESSSGNVQAKSLKFLGGQGDWPSVGGRFQLEDNFQPRFRAFIPLRPINKPEW